MVKAALKENPKATKAAYFIVAENRAHARNQVEHEWGWKRDGANWLDHTGNSVKFTDEAKVLARAAGRARVFVYLGHRHYASLAQHILDDLVTRRVVTVLPDPTPDKK